MKNEELRMNSEGLGRACYPYALNSYFVNPAALVAILLLWAGCTSVNESAYTPQLVVQGYLYANEPFDSIVVRRTIPIGSTGDNDRVSGALVVISSDAGGDTLREDVSSSRAAGRYIAKDSIIIQPGKTYNLLVQVSGYPTVTSSTTVPFAIHLDSATYRGRRLSITAIDTVVYPVIVDSLQSPSVHLWWSSSSNAAGYALEALSLDPNADTIKDLITGQLQDTSANGRYHFFILSTNEEVLWPQFTRFGLNAVRALAIDRNFEDFILGLYLSGSQFNNNTLHVQGGLGIFGSAARTSKLVYLE